MSANDTTTTADRIAKGGSVKRIDCTTCGAYGVTIAHFDNCTWDDQAWCAHGGHVQPVSGCQFCPEGGAA